MSQSTVGGYQGPVVVLSADGEEIARAACRYRAEPDNRGDDHWHGRLHRVSPPGTVTAGAYRLQFPSGEHGDVLVESVATEREIIHFVGAGNRPLYPLQESAG